MKYLIIPYIALGLVLSLAIGIEYHCEGPEMFPDYYGSPFVFKQKSLGSSMEYFYSISGVLLNVVIWSLALFIIHAGVKNLIRKMSRPKWIRFSYNILIGFLIVFTTLNIWIDSVMIGRGFEEGQNYWYWNIDKEAQDWGMSCEGKVILFRE
ncbi:hypothetical protein [Flavobacterium hydrophilum]|uniref:Uncharacterized protein n=1 Tax=Flavobacterium hydrophilum TaxID=2211445 RepID=A0A2V4BZ11_9FLAO|nr:hypothetical protein [Flavobacterium hydrophilum]PXY44296.1 hypothetical protein DMB68_17910 [Flavobacterium hydrophilum]